MTRSADEPVVGPFSTEFLLSIGYRPAARHIDPSIAVGELRPQPLTLLTPTPPPKITMNALLAPANDTPQQRVPAVLEKNSQFILAIDSQYFTSRGWTNGIQGYPLARLYQEVSPYLAIRQRAALERNPKYRQILPYKVLRQNGKIVAYRRLKAGGESRLYGLLSIGFGGHVDLEDAVCYAGSEAARSTVDLETTIRASSAREISQEVHYVTASGGQAPFEPSEDEIVAANMFIHYDLREQQGDLWKVENDVHSVHVAFVYNIEVDPRLELVSGEPEQIEMLPPMTAKELYNSGMPMEEWTRLLLEFMIEQEALAAGVAAMDQR